MHFQAENERRRRDLAGYGIDAALLNEAGAQAIVAKAAVPQPQPCQAREPPRRQRCHPVGRQGVSEQVEDELCELGLMEYVHGLLPPDWRQRVAYVERIRQAAARRPGVASVAVSVSDLPPSLPFHSSRVEVSGFSDNRQAVLLSKVSDEYFDTLRLPIVLGITSINLPVVINVMQAADIAAVRDAEQEGRKSTARE